MFGIGEKKSKPVAKEVNIISHCTQNCGKEKCPQWVVMDQTYIADGKTEIKKEGKCAIAWIPTLLVELRQALEKKNGNS